MKFNGTIFSKPQQDQLKENIGNELEKVSIKIDEIDARMPNYTSKTYSMTDPTQREQLINDVKNAILNHKRALTLLTDGNREYLLTWDFYTSANPEAVYGGCIAGTANACLIGKIYVNLNDYGLSIYTLSSSNGGAISVSSATTFTSLTVMLEQ